MSNPQDETSDWYSQDAATFGDRVSAAREQSGLTQRILRVDWVFAQAPCAIGKTICLNRVRTVCL